MPIKNSQLDLQFHLKVAESSSNSLISLVMEPLYSLLPRIKTLIVHKVKSKNKYTALYYHQNVYDKIENQDEQGALKAMNEHLQVAEKDAKLLIENSDNELISDS